MNSTKQSPITGKATQKQRIFSQLSLSNQKAQRDPLADNDNTKATGLESSQNIYMKMTQNPKRRRSVASIGSTSSQNLSELHRSTRHIKLLLERRSSGHKSPDINNILTAKGDNRKLMFKVTSLRRDLKESQQFVDPCKINTKGGKGKTLQ